MNLLKTLILAAALALVACATVPAPSIGIIDTPFTAADGTRSIQFSGWIPAPPADVYAAIATTDGWKRWA
ncbi:MAG: hypothetical protein ABMA14_21270, partial [Hyphomonadaceae bacterium]